MKRALFVLATVSFNLAVLEMLAAILGFTVPGLFERPGPERIAWLTDFDAYEDFLRGQFDPVTGWRTPLSGSSRRRNCLDESIEYHFDAAGARVTPLPGRARILIVGDSYTFGDEVHDDETYPSRLARLLDVPVANYGVGGYGPTQALLRLEQKLPLHPEAQVAILSIMYENLGRMRNAYRPAFYAATGIQFGFKPYMRVERAAGSSAQMRARVAPNPNAIPAATPAQLRARVEAALQSDYWTTGERRFPYSLALVRTLRRESVRLRVLGSLGSRWGKYASQYGHPGFQAAVIQIARRLVRLGRERGLEAKVFFLPQNSKGLGTPAELVARINREVEPGLAHDVGRMDFEWAKYNLKPDSCHPTAAAQRAIAGFMAERIGRRH